MILLLLVAFAFAACSAAIGVAFTIPAVWRLATGRDVSRSLATIGAGVSGATLAWLLWRLLVWEETGGVPTGGLMPACDAASWAIGYGWSAGIAFIIGELVSLVSKSMAASD